jgi:flavin reductase (DIM6/NTAB) family NADH-FMN oxidoreductase RutF
MVINLLSSERAAVAVKFSRPDLYPEPFRSVPYSLTREGLPVFERSLRTLSCKLVSSVIPLHDLDYLEKGKLAEKEARDLGDMVISSGA